MGVTARSFVVAAAPVVIAGACLGFWMFSFRGLLLFGGAGLMLSVSVGVLARLVPRGAAALPLVLAAAALYSSSTLGWGAADASDGTRFKVSPVGVSHVLTPRQTVSDTINCGWYAASGYTAPCAVIEGGYASFVRLRAVYPLVLAAAASCLIGALLSLDPTARRRHLMLCPSGAAGGAVLAVVLFANSFGAALQDLQGLVAGTGGSLGTMQLTIAVLLCLTVSGSRIESAAIRRSWTEC